MLRAGETDARGGACTKGQGRDRKGGGGMVMQAIKSRWIGSLGALALAIVASAAMLFAATGSEYPTGSVADPDVYKVIKENDFLRLMLVTHPPHSRDAWHSHPAYAYYFLDDCETTLHSGDSVHSITAIQGSAGLVPARQKFSFENTGDKPCRLVVVERK